VITFTDDYSPEEGSLEAAATALERGQLVEVAWPTRTAEMLVRKESGRATILRDLEERGGGAAGVKQYDDFLSDARRYAAAGDRLPHVVRAVVSAGTTAAQAPPSIETFLRFANLMVLKSLAWIMLEGEDSSLEDELRLPWLSDLFNSTPGRRALGVSEQIYSADVWQRGREPNVDVFAPRSLIEGLRTGDRLKDDELFVRWAIPQFELHLVGTATEFEYPRERLSVVKCRDDGFVEM
jgi:hypothetical protein